MAAFGAFDINPMMAPGMQQNQMNAWEQAMQKQRTNLALSGQANQLQQIGIQGKNALQLQQAQGATASGIAAGVQAGETQRTGMQTASVERQVAAAQAGQTQRTQMEQAGLTEREKMAVQGQIDVTTLTTQEQERVGKYQSDQQLAGTKYASDTTAKTAADQLAATTARFNQILPMVQNAYTQFQNSTGNGTSNITADLSALQAGAPQIDATVPFTPRAMQESRNQLFSTGQTSAASQTHKTNNDLAGRGFGANSPLAKMLSTMTSGQERATDVPAASNMRTQQEIANQQAVAAAQQARANQYQGLVGSATQLQANRYGVGANLLQTLANLAHG